VPLSFLQVFLKRDDPRAYNFRQNIRIYNFVFAFMFVSYIKNIYINLFYGLHCFQIYGELFHYQGPL
jgi:hypothetical protein